MARMTIDEMSDFLGRDRLEVRNLLLAFQRNPERAGMVRRGLAALCRKAGVDPDDPSQFLPPRADKLPSDGIFLGHANGSGSPVRIPLRLFQRVVLLCGAPGRGKSTLLFSIIQQLIALAKKVVLFDFTGEHRSLCQLFGPDRLLAVSHKDIQANVWEARCDPQEHIQDMSDIFWEAVNMHEGSTHEMTQLVTELYRERGVFAGSKDFPTQDDVERRLAQLVSDPRIKPGSRRSTWLESATRLKSVFAYLPGFRAKSSEGLRKLFEKSVIIDVSELSGIPLDFFCIFIVKFLERETSGTFPDEVERVIIFEEAHNVASAIKEKRLSFQEPYIVKCARTLRKHGDGICYVDQAPASLSGALLSCVEITISFGVSGPQSIRAVQYLTGLSEDRARYLAELGDRQAVVQSGELGPAFLMNVPEIQVPPRPSQQEVRGRMAPIVKALFPEDVAKTVSVHDKGLPRDTDKPRVPAWFTPDVRKVLESIAARPYYCCEKRANEVGMNPAAENVARRTLMNYGVVEETARFGKGRKLYGLTPKGRDWCTELKIPIFHHKGSLDHLACVHAVVASILQASPKIVLCKSFSAEGVQPDAVLALPNGGRLAIQVCCSRNDDREADNLLKLCENPGIEKVVLCGKDKVHTDAVRRAVSTKRSGGLPNKLIFVTAEECVSNKVDWTMYLSGLGV